MVVDDRVGEINNGHATVAERTTASTSRGSTNRRSKWVRYEPKAEMLVLDKVYEQEGIYLPDIFFDTNIIQMPTVKTHVFTGTTGAMKNAFGGLLQEHRHWTHSVIHETLVDLLAIQKEIHTGIFAVMDGTICGDGPGPAGDDAVRQGLHPGQRRPGGHRRGGGAHDGLRPHGA